MLLAKSTSREAKRGGGGSPTVELLTKVLSITRCHLAGECIDKALVMVLHQCAMAIVDNELQTFYEMAVVLDYLEGHTTTNIDRYLNQRIQQAKKGRYHES